MTPEERRYTDIDLARYGATPAAPAALVEMGRGMPQAPGAIPQTKAQAEDTKNLTMANAMMGGGTPGQPAPSPLERFTPAGEVPYGVSIPGMARDMVGAMPEQYKEFERGMMRRMYAGEAPRIREGELGAIPSPMQTRLTDRVSEIVDRLSGGLRRVTRANLTKELTSIMSFLGGAYGTETQRAMKEAELGEKYAAGAIPGMRTLAELRKGEREAEMLPWNIREKIEGLRTGEAKRGLFEAQTGALGAVTRQREAETAVLPTTKQELVQMEQDKRSPSYETRYAARLKELIAAEKDARTTALNTPGVEYKPTKTSVLQKRAAKLAEKAPTAISTEGVAKGRKPMVINEETGKIHYRNPDDSIGKEVPAEELR